MMRVTRGYLGIKTMIDIYYTYFYPHLLYGIEFWSHGNKTDLNSRTLKLFVKNIQW